MSGSQASPYVGEVRIFAGANAPDGWLPCNGQALRADDYPELFAVLGSRYGASGTREFCLPDLRSRAVMGSGQGTGLTPRNNGDVTGTAHVTLETRHLPRHKHRVYACTAAPAATAAEQWLLASSSKRAGAAGSAPPGTTTPVQIALDRTARAGGSCSAHHGSVAAHPTASYTTPHASGTIPHTIPHENRQPYLGLNFCIAWRGRV